MSNQLGGPGALWTERDKRPCVRGGLLIYRLATPSSHIPAARMPRSLRRDGATPALVALAPWRRGRSPGAHGCWLTSNLRGCAAFASSSAPRSQLPASHDRGPQAAGAPLRPRRESLE